MIVACTSCSAQYTLADAKVRGRKVRATCKHCGTAFVIDGTEKAPEPLSLPKLDSLMGSDAYDDATRVAARPDFSVHDEPTVIGQIPAAALEAERRYAQRTLPPPANEPAPPPSSEPAAPAAKPIATATIERALPPYSSEPTLLIPTPAIATAPPRTPSPEPALLSADDLEPEHPPRSKRTVYLLLALALTLAVSAVVVLTGR